MRTDRLNTWSLIASLVLASGAAVAGFAPAPALQKGDEFAPLEAVTQGLEKVVSTADGAASLWDLYADRKSGKLIAVLPASHEKQLLMIACTVAAGDPQAGVMGPTHFARWERFDRQLALVAPDLSVRSGGDKQSADSVQELFTGTVMLTTPIIGMAPGNRPIIDLGTVATANVPRLFGPSIYGGYGASLTGVNPSLRKLTKAKAFPENLVIEFEAPRADGRIVRFAYSIGELSGTPGFKPRKASSKVGFFYNWHEDFSKASTADVAERYIARWNIEKRDPNLKLSPPKAPLVWHIEHTVPVKFRRYVREGIEMWNPAFEEIGILGALEVRQQDDQTGAFMDIDPEDARYNFFRWNTTNYGYAIGPSRWNPYTGQILDADVVWHQGLTRSMHSIFENLTVSITENAFGPEGLAWLAAHPDWDPRVVFAPAARRAEVQRTLAEQADEPPAHAFAASMAHGGGCTIGRMLSMEVNLADAAFVAGLLETGDEELLDGLPEEYLGQMIRYISAHEVGHCLGLQHNMISSSIRSLEEMNSGAFEGPTIGSVMDYAAPNINHELGEKQGPWATAEVGPYDRWAIAYGYGPEDKLEGLLARASEPDLIFQSQAAIAFGGDPRNQTWELGSDNLAFARSRLGLVREVRERLLEDVVQDGEPWAVARRRYDSVLGTHLQMLAVASRWVGGSFTENLAKGDDGEPIRPVPGAKQREALQLVIDNAFVDEAFGLTPELLRHMTREYWYDPSASGELMSDAEYSVHNTVAGMQATALSMLLNPATLRRVYDNEFRDAGAKDLLTLNEVLTTVTDAAWSECAKPSSGTHTASSPMISSFRRSLQHEHVNRLVTLALLNNPGSPSLRTIKALAGQELRRVDELAAKGLGAKADPYTRAHLGEVRERIAKALEASVVLPR